jgi:branched-chain amino acid aminotransferase
MVNYNGSLVALNTIPISQVKRALSYGDGLFETMRMREGKVLFIEDHYFRLMASMRILRMTIPMEFTPEFLVEECEKLALHFGYTNARLRFQVVRNGMGKYTPVQSNGVHWWVEIEPLGEADYTLRDDLTVDLFKDHPLQAGLLTTVKSTNALPYILSGIFATENNLDAVLLINDQKMVVEANYGNLFLLQGSKLITPPLEDGALRGVFRKNMLVWAKELGLDIEEKSISPFDLQKADELWITNTIKGVQAIKTYRKKTFSSIKAAEAVALINRKLEVLSKL